MPGQKRRIVAFGGLMGIASLLTAACMLSQSLPYLERHRGMLKKARAWMVGARLISSNEAILQLHGNDCGAAALKAVMAIRGIELPLSDLASDLQLTPRGTSMLNLRLISTKLGVPAKSWMMRPKDLLHVPLPAIAFINKNHFVVIRRFVAPEILEVDDPALGRLRWPIRAFQRVWSGETLVFDPAWSPL
jgi:hypothetical protein